MSTILFLQELDEAQQQQIQSTAPQYQLKAVPAKQADASLFKDAEIIVGWSKKLADYILAEDCPVKWIQTWSAGVDNMPLEKLHHKQVQLTSANGVHTVPISEQIFGYMLAFSRNFHQAIRQQSKQTWDTSGTFTELKGKSIAIVGVGNIGQETARLAQAFGMHTIGVRRSGEATEYIKQMYTMDKLDTALAEADYVVNILPLTDETQQLFNQERFAAMKKNAIFINVGRGSTVDTDALVHALEEKVIAGAGLDVFDPEPLPEDHVLWNMEQVIITPHIAGSNEHYTERVLDIFLTNLKSYQENQTLPVNLVDYGKKY
ncbi:D-2-hydroxyacid dehydrogenase [Paenibacillus nuruki]|uniref:D-2-hydroxyacid dehydrogenase n=1 Tax=Paenibacillus nuruki TaxID=1886670 RepID=UPI002805B159|nr:D-2-hydroxyacid dehydrogenase [Paenibacillus nuruki]CAJ1316272.1 Phosphoglycerate dehydrogenase [Paenibacillus nuruki]